MQHAVGFVVERQLAAFPFRIDEGFVGARHVLALDQLGVPAQDIGDHVVPRPVTFLIDKIFVDHLGFRRTVGGEQFAIDQWHEHLGAASGHVPEMLPGAGFGEDLVQQRAAAGAEERRFDEWIFFLKAIDDLFALIQSHGGVEDHLAFFFRALDQPSGRGSLRTGEPTAKSAAEKRS